MVMTPAKGKRRVDRSVGGIIPEAKRMGMKGETSIENNFINFPGPGFKRAGLCCVLDEYLDWQRT